jgi:DNA transformation protein
VNNHSRLEAGLSGTADHVAELLSGLGPVVSKRMFGGHGVMFDGMMIGVIFGETLYLKVDDLTEPAFEAAGSERFTYAMKDGRTGRLRYWRLPDGAQDDPDEAERWGRLAVEAARRAKAPKKGKGKTARADIGPGPWDG